MSYAIPYGLVGLCGGSLLSLATHKYALIPIFGIAGFGYGMIRNNNVKRVDDNCSSSWDSFFSFCLKALTIYVLGPTLLVIGIFAILAIAS